MRIDRRKAIVSGLSVSVLSFLQVPNVGAGAPDISVSARQVGDGQVEIEWIESRLHIDHESYQQYYWKIRVYYDEYLAWYYRIAGRELGSGYDPIVIADDDYPPGDYRIVVELVSQSDHHPNATGETILTVEEE